MDSTVMPKLVAKSNSLLQKLREPIKCLICTTDLLAKEKLEKVKEKTIMLEFQLKPAPQVIQNLFKCWLLTPAKLSF